MSGNRNRVSAVIFDCDGVLVDSRAANVAAYQNLLERGGYGRPAAEAILGCYAMTVEHTITQLTGIEDETEISRLKNIFNAPDIRNPLLCSYPPTLHNVLRLIGASYELAVATSRSRMGLNDVFGAADLHQYFDVTIAREDYVNPKPHPEPLILAAGRLGIESAHAVYIGDSFSDIEAAVSAGMRSIHLSPEPCEKADLGIADLSELPVAIRKLEA